ESVAPVQVDIPGIEGQCARLAADDVDRVAPGVSKLETERRPEAPLRRQLSRLVGGIIFRLQIPNGLVLRERAAGIHVAVAGERQIDIGAALQVGSLAAYVRRGNRDLPGQ